MLPTPAAPRLEHHPNGRLGIGEARPRLSWHVAGAAPGYRQHGAQVEITVAGADGVRTTSTHDLRSAAQVLVPWPAPPLRSRDRVGVRRPRGRRNAVGGLERDERRRGGAARRVGLAGGAGRSRAGQRPARPAGSAPVDVHAPCRGRAGPAVPLGLRVTVDVPVGSSGVLDLPGVPVRGLTHGRHEAVVPWPPRGGTGS